MDHLRNAHDLSIMAHNAIQSARDCREFCIRKGHPISPTVNRIIQRHVKNARKFSRAAVQSYRHAGRYS
jgi:hypothetical protein